MGHRAHTNVKEEASLIPESYRSVARYSLDLETNRAEDQHSVALDRVEAAIEGYRLRHLKEPFASDESKLMFQFSFEEWKTIDRTKVPGWRCSVRQPVTLEKMPPYSQSDLHLLDRVSIVRAAVTELEVDAIVNAANEGCLGGGGVDGAVHAAAGDLLLRECSTFNGCATGHTRITKGYALPARFVLHTVGPIGKKPALLQSCYRTCLQLAAHHGLTSVGFCCVSTGVFGYPLADATTVALTEVFRFLKHNGPEVMRRVVFACFTKFEHDEYLRQVDDVYRRVMSCADDEKSC